MKVAVQYIHQDEEWLVLGQDARQREFARFITKWDALEYTWRCQEDPKCGVTGVEIYDREGNFRFETVAE